MNSKIPLKWPPSKATVPRILAALYCVAISGTSFAAGFDCSKAASNVEKMICSDEVLSSLDSQLQKTYLLALGDASFPKREDIKRNQVQWITNLRDKCGDRKCLQEAYSSQLEILALIKTATVSAHYVVDGSEATRTISEFQKQLKDDGFSGDLKECNRVIKVDPSIPPNEPVLSSAKDPSYGAICSLNSRVVMICDDTMIGKTTLKLTGFTGSGPALVEFTQSNCAPGG
jgi:uncharacterized protein